MNQNTCPFADLQTEEKVTNEVAAVFKLFMMSSQPTKARVEANRKCE